MNARFWRIKTISIYFSFQISHTRCSVPTVAWYMRSVRDCRWREVRGRKPLLPKINIFTQIKTIVVFTRISRLLVQWSRVMSLDYFSLRESNLPVVEVRHTTLTVGKTRGAAQAVHKFCYIATDELFGSIVFKIMVCLK